MSAFPLDAFSHTLSRSGCAKIRPHRQQSYRLKTIGDQPVSDYNKNETADTPASNNAENDPAPGQNAPDSAPSGPKFTKGSDPLAGVKKRASDAMATMEGKTVSMKLYVGTIIGVVVLMLLARCGG